MKYLLSVCLLTECRCYPIKGFLTVLTSLLHFSFFEIEINKLCSVCKDIEIPDFLWDRPNFSGSHTLSQTATAKSWASLIQTLTSLCSLRPDFGRNADWLLEQCHKIWLAVGINGSWKRLFLAWLFSRMISWSILLPFLWPYSRKIYLKFRCLFISSQDWLYLRNYKCECIAELNLSFELLTANNVPFDLPTNECN